MGLEVYYPQDIRNAILAAEQSNNAAVMAIAGEDPPQPYVCGYNAGYIAALTTIALAFGLLSPGETQPPQGFRRRKSDESDVLAEVLGVLEDERWR